MRDYELYVVEMVNHEGHELCLPTRLQGKDGNAYHLVNVINGEKYFVSEHSLVFVQLLGSYHHIGKLI